MAFINRSMQPVVWARALREPFIKVSGHKERRARKTQRERGKESEGERERNCKCASILIVQQGEECVVKSVSVYWCIREKESESEKEIGETAPSIDSDID